MRKKLGVTVFVFFRNWGRKLQFFAGFCMCFNCKSKGSLNQTVAAKKLYLEFFSKTARTFLIHFSWHWEGKKWGSPCSFLLCEQKCLRPSLTQLPKVPNTPSGSVQDRCIQWIGHGAVCWTLNFGPARSRFVSGLAGDHCPSTSQLGRATLSPWTIFMISCWTMPDAKLHRSSTTCNSLSYAFSSLPFSSSSFSSFPRTFGVLLFVRWRPLDQGLVPVAIYLSV